MATHGQARARRRSRGFTLIEILVVLALLAVILAIVGLNLTPDAGRSVRDEATRLALLLQTAREEAILQGGVIAVTLERDGYEFHGLNEKGELQAIEQDDTLRARRLPPGVEMTRREVEGLPENKTSVLILYPSGELTAFHVTLAHDEVQWSVVGTVTGEIRAAAPYELETL